MIIKKLSLILLLLIPSCKADSKIKDASLFEDHWVSTRTFSFLGDETNLAFTFPIEHKGCEGIGFIADHRIWTVKHLIEEKEYIDITYEDLFTLSESNLHGLSICRRRHKQGDKAYTIVQNGKTTIEIKEKTKYYFKGFINKAIRLGDSGTPIFCSLHRKVIGIVSARERIEDLDIVWIANIQNERKTSCEKENEKKSFKKD